MTEASATFTAGAASMTFSRPSPADLSPSGRRKSPNALAWSASFGSNGTPILARLDAIWLTADWTVDCWFSSSLGISSGFL